MSALDPLAGRDVPLRRPDVEWVELDGAAVLHDPRTGNLHQLNASAAAVWAACDGSTSVDEIVGTMRETYAGSDGTILRDVHETLAQLLSKGLADVVQGGQPPTEAPPPSTGDQADDEGSTPGSAAR